MARTWRIGERLEDRWEVHNILQGGAGVVYIVYDYKFREPFAAKTYRDDVFELAPEVSGRFMQESLTWVNLDVHPNIARARMAKEIEGKPFLFLEFISGGDLRSWIGTPRLLEDLPQTLRFSIQFCDGMIHALKKGILVHRDIKPQNCLIGQGQTLKVTDFGLARCFDEVEASKARKVLIPGMSIEASMGGPEGTCTHMAPEQFDDARKVDVRADIYSFGVMLYQMLTGELPFLGTSWEEMEQLHRTQPPPLIKDADQRLNEIIQTCLAKKADQRFKDFGEVREWLTVVYTRKTGKPAPEPVVGSELGSAEWNNKGASLAILGKHEEAIACYDKALEMSPDFAQALANKGAAWMALGKVAEAVMCYDQALQMNPQLEAIWTHKGVALKTMGRIPEALECYERAMKINPRFPEAWVNKGVALRAMKKPEEALACYDRALRLNPHDEIAWANKGNAQYALGRHFEAIAAYDKALALNPRLDQTWLNRGLSLTVLSRYDEAMRCFDKAIELNPSLAQAWYQKGVVLVNGFQKYRDALPYLEQAERLGAPQAGAAVAQCKQALGIR